ncbi:muscular LMNA-interacting protein isoform 2-T2 [Discoglossus pictus]
MELEKHKTEYASSNILRKKIMNTVYCEEEPVGLPVIKPGDCKKSFEMQRENWSAELHTKPKSPVEPASGRLTFSFVPSTGILPTEVQFGKDSNIAPKVVKSMNSWTGEGMALKPGGVSENVSLKNILVEDEITSVGGKTNSKQTCPGMNTCSNNVKDLQQTDLFIAEFVIVVDSEEEDDLVNMSNESLPFKGKVHESSGAQVSSTEEPAANVSSVNVNEIFVPEAQPDELSHDMDCQEKELQLYSSVTRAGHIPNKLQDLNLNWSPNQSFTYKKHPIICVSESQEYFNYSGPANKHDEIAQTKNLPKCSEVSPSTVFAVPRIITSSPSINSELTTSHIKSSNAIIASHYPSDSKFHHPGTSVSPVCDKSRAFSPLPINIIKHPLSPSPSPLQSPFYGSSSTICSVTESYRPISPAVRSEAVSPSPSRLSYLTSMLKSEKVNHRRALSPEFYQYNLTSKSAQTMSSTKSSVLPRKSVSCFSLDNSQRSKMAYFQKKDRTPYTITPSASESNIKDFEDVFHKPIRTLSPDSVHFKASKNIPYPRKSVESPSSPIQMKTLSSPYCSRENISPLNVKPPLMKDSYKPIKKYSVLGKSRNVSPPAVSPSSLSHSLSYFTSQKHAISPHSNKKKYTSPGDQYSTTSQASRNPEDQNYYKNIPITHSPSVTHTDKPSYSSLHSVLENSHTLYPDYRSHSNAFSLEELPRKYDPRCISPDNIQTSSGSGLLISSELSSPHSFSQCSDHDNKKPYKIKSSYKAFAAIPTNTLLLDQKAVDEPEKNALEETMETHSEVYSPALLRQQTEEICAAIDQVLHDPLPLHSESTSKSSKKKLLPKTIKIAKSPSKSAGRETKYASVQLPMANSCSSSKSTKPGVIRPLSLKINIPEKDEENYFPNPFKQFTLASSRRDIDYERS